MTKLLDDECQRSLVTTFFDALGDSRPADVQQYDDKFIANMNVNSALSAQISTLLVKLATDEVS